MKVTLECSIILTHKDMALFDTPSHVIPPVSALFTPFMDSLVARKDNTAAPGSQKGQKENAPAFKKPEPTIVEKEKNTDDIDAKYHLFIFYLSILALVIINLTWLVIILWAQFSRSVNQKLLAVLQAKGLG